MHRLVPPAPARSRLHCAGQRQAHAGAERGPYLHCLQPPGEQPQLHCLVGLLRLPLHCCAGLLQRRLHCLAGLLRLPLHCCAGLLAGQTGTAGMGRPLWPQWSRARREQHRVAICATVACCAQAAAYCGPPQAAYRFVTLVDVLYEHR